MKISQITDYLEAIAPLYLQEDYDNSGLIVGNKNTIVKKALICIDSIEETINEAIKKKCNLIIAHHPIVFKGFKKLTEKSYIEKTLVKAIKNDIAIYAIHTNLDNVFNGVNKKICDTIGLTDYRILKPKKHLLSKLVTYAPLKHTTIVRNALFKEGAGKIGNYDMCSFNSIGEGTFRASKNSNPYIGRFNEYHTENETKIEVIVPKYLEQQIIENLLKVHPYEEVAYELYPILNSHPKIGSGMIGFLKKETDIKKFLSALKRKMKIKQIRHTKIIKNKVQKIAVCGGSGSFLLDDAIKNKADLFISSDFKYHQFFDANKDIIIADIGHYESEQFTKDLIFDLLIKKFPKFAIILSETNTNPISYF